MNNHMNQNNINTSSLNKESIKRKNEKQNLTEIKETSKEILLSSSINGIPNLIRTKRFGIRLMWSICILVSLGISSYMVVESILEFLSYEVATKIRKLNQFPSPFPDVTICSSNLFTTNYSSRLLSELRLNYSIDVNYKTTPNIYNSTSPYFMNNIYNNLEFVRYVAQSYAMSDKMTDEEKQKLGLSINDMLISCHFAGADCSHNDFSWKYNFDYGNCFTFRPDLNLNRSITRTGKWDGLILEMFMGIPVTTTMDSGAYVFISNDSISVSNDEPVGIPLGFETNLAIGRLFTIQLEKPYSNCNLKEATPNSYNSDLYQLIIKSNQSYSQKDCYDLCYQQQVVKKCNCSDLNFILLPNTLPCLDPSEIMCLYDVYEVFGTENINKLCDHQCPLECQSESFTYKSTQTLYPSVLYANQLNKHPKIIKNFNNSTVNFDVLRKAIFKLNVYYEELSYIVITEMPTLNGVSLISNIGGTLGLFLGFSFLSLIEFMEILLEIFLIGTCNSSQSELNKLEKQSNKTHQSNNDPYHYDERFFHYTNNHQFLQKNEMNEYNKKKNGCFKISNNEKKIFTN